MNPLINKQLIFEFLSGNATVLQRKQIDEWSQEPQNEELFYEWLQEWERTHLQYQADRDKAFEQYQEFLHHNQRPRQVSQETSFFRRWNLHRNWLFSSAAASVILVIGCYYLGPQLLKQTYRTNFGQTQVVTLPDGSQVTLNANSTLKVPLFGFTSHRQVWLEGEALFSVQHTATNEQFVVKTSRGADVVVLGTEFNLYSRARGTEVALHRGKVEFHYHKSGKVAAPLTLKPGDLVNVSPSGKAQLKKAEQSRHFSAWRDGRYVFKETSLRELTYLFEENFGITLVIPEPETAALTLSGTYPTENAEELLSIIAEVLNLRIIRHNKQVFLQSTSIT
ncbi:FecR domain-containing protein [Siphonobacter sp. SORGH_AS_0500]|uniref:FecR family protein n=1 Tax=Siphonobacter sp. SORGH_AS_0500 TaxID=1864824 RepID=UPI00285A5FB1|nr:FecR domain-containing protein [Siphonobacter sp. SORGH_AS_0500]MDR6197726.1 transmembrane sensor [Siphonobacter sp. SORGH_AS_0500]